MNELCTQLEAVLFYRGEPTSVKKLASLLEREEAAVRDGLEDLQRFFTEHSSGLTLVWNDDEVMLGTAPSAAELLQRITKDELTRDLGKPGLETLSIILYKGPISRREIDYIRGVNSTFILRNLLIRGLIERIPAPNDQRSFLYKASIDLIAHLGITKKEELPEYAEVQAELAKVEAAAAPEQKAEVEAETE